MTLMRATPDGNVPMTPEEEAEFLATQVPVLSMEQIILGYTMAVQAHLDEAARERGYDSILSACTYVDSTVPRFAAEGQAAINWRDAVWSACYTVMHEVKTGMIELPTQQELIAALPVIAWPE